MPRVPEGNFNRRPSTRVGGARVPNTGDSGARELKKLGGQFLKISDALEQAKVSAEGLEAVNNQETRLHNELFPELDSLMKRSKKGVVHIEEEESDEGIALSDAFSKAISKYETKALSSFSSSGESGLQSKVYYDTFIRPKLDSYMARAKNFETKQLADSVEKGIVDRINLYRANVIEGTMTPDQLEKERLGIQRTALDSIDSLGSDKSDALVASVGHSSAAGAIGRLGNLPVITDADEKLTYELINQTPDPAARKLFTMEAKKKIKNLRVAGNKAGLKAVKELSKINNLQEYMLKKNDLQSALKHFSSNEALEGVDPAQQLKAVTELAGTILAYEKSIAPFLPFRPGAPSENKELEDQLYSDVILKEFGVGNKFKQQLIDKFKIKDDTDFDKMLSDTIAKTANRVEASINNYMVKDFTGYMQSWDSSVIKGMRSPIESVRNAAYDMFNQKAGEAGVINPSIVSKPEADAANEIFKEIKKEGFDKDGSMTHEEITKFFQQFPDYKFRASSDMIDFNGMPAFSHYIPHFSDQSDARLVSKAWANYEQNLDFLAKEQILQSSAGKALSSAGSTWKKRLSVGLNVKKDYSRNLYLSQGNQANSIYTGRREGIEVLAAEYSARFRDIDKGIKLAVETYDREFPVAISGDNTLLATKKYLDKNKVPREELTDIIKSVSKLEFTSKLGMDVDMSKMKEMYKKNPKHLALINSYENMGKGTEFFEDTIVALPSPDEDNKIRLYIRPDKASGMLPLIRTEEGIMKTFDIDIKEYYDVMIEERANVESARSVRQAGSIIGTTQVGTGR